MTKKRTKKAQKARKSARDIQTPVSNRENSSDSEEENSRQGTAPHGTQAFSARDFTSNIKPSQQNLVETAKANNLTEGSGFIGARLGKGTLPLMRVTTIQRTEQIKN